MYILLDFIVDKYIRESKPINGIVHVGAYDETLHDQYKCHVNEKIVWVSKHDIQQIKPEILLQNIEPYNFLNVTMDGQELQTLQQLINDNIEYIYTQTYDHDYNSVCVKFKQLNEFMISNNFKLEAYTLVNNRGVTQFAGLYIRTA